MKIAFTGAILTVLSCGAAFCQSTPPAPEFEVANIKTSKAGSEQRVSFCPEGGWKCKA